jgi:hypothetical protein
MDKSNFVLKRQKKNNYIFADITRLQEGTVSLKSNPTPEAKNTIQF